MLLTVLLHLVDLLLMASLIGFPLLPLLVCDLSHDLHRLLRFLLLFFQLALLVLLYLLVTRLSLLLDQTILQPAFECLVTFLLIHFLFQMFGFLST